MNNLHLSEEFAGAPLLWGDYEDNKEDSCEEELTAYSEVLLDFNCWYRDPRDLTDVATVTTTSSSVCTMTVSNYETRPEQFGETFVLHIPDESNAYSLVVETKTVSKSEESEADVDRLYQTLQSLSETWQDCLVENWDGYGAQPIPRNTYREAVKLLTLIPLSVPMPEVIPEPSGEIAFEWYKSEDSLFVISVGGRNVITYAGLFGEKNKAHGTEYFHDKLPKTILHNIRRLYV